MQLLPRDQKFFDLLLDQAKIAFDASGLLADGLQGGSTQPNFRDTARKVRDLELKGDEAVRNIYRRLHKTFITPIDPEDVHQLAKLLNDILDHLDAVAYRLEAYGLERSPERIPEVDKNHAGIV